MTEYEVIKDAASAFLKAIFKNEDILLDENFRETPDRIAKVYGNLIQDSEHIKKQVFECMQKRFPSDYKGIILLPNIRATGLCPHHMLIVDYTIHIAYIPDDCVCGASKPERVARLLAKNAPLQEDYTERISRALIAITQNVAVVVHGEHSCMRIRGVKNPCASMRTSVLSGAFKENLETREEFFELLKGV